MNQWRLTYTGLAQMTKPPKGSIIDVGGNRFRVLDVTDLGFSLDVEPVEMAEL